MPRLQYTCIIARPCIEYVLIIFIMCLFCTATRLVKKRGTATSVFSRRPHTNHIAVVGSHGFVQFYDPVRDAVVLEQEGMYGCLRDHLTHYCALLCIRQQYAYGWRRWNVQ